MGKSKKCSPCSCSPCVPKTEKVYTQVSLPASIFSAGDTGTVTGYSLVTANISSYVGAAFATKKCSPCGTDTSYIPTDLLITSAHAVNSTGGAATANGTVFGASYTSSGGVVTLTLAANILLAVNRGVMSANGAAVLTNIVLLLSGSKPAY